MPLRRLSFALAITPLLWGSSRADDQERVEPGPRHGPALPLGYSNSPASRLAVFISAERDLRSTDTAQDHDLVAAELAYDARLPIDKRQWLLSWRLPVMTSDLRADDTHEREVHVGNLGFEVSHVNQLDFNAEAFAGVLFPVFSFGAVFPISTSPDGGRVPMRSYADALTLYRRDTAALSAAAHLRLDLFVFYHLSLETGVKLEIIDTGDVLTTADASAGFSPFGLEWWRGIIEGTWVRESGEPDLVEGACTPMARDACFEDAGSRSLLRLGTTVTFQVHHRQAVELGVRWTTAIQADAIGESWTGDVAYVF